MQASLSTKTLATEMDGRALRGHDRAQPTEHGSRRTKMLHRSRARIVNDIEFLVTDPKGRPGQRQWTTLGIECRLVRHSYNGSLYSYDLSVLNVRAMTTAATAWEHFIFTELWRETLGQSIHRPKWLKRLTGKSFDVMN
jgi:hypothetical protein